MFLATIDKELMFEDLVHKLIPKNDRGDREEILKKLI